jgi:hypothetical protein
MSVVTNIMISGLFDDHEIPIVEAELLRLTKQFMPFTLVEAGGPKNFECDVYAAAFNYLDSDLFIEVIKGLERLINKHTYEDVQVFIKRDDDVRWEVYLASELSKDCF